MITAKKLGQYMGVEFDKRAISNTDMRVITYQAYNAFGLIGSECNGIAILDERNQAVVLDEHLKQQSGYCGASQSQLLEAERIVNLGSDELNAFINNHERKR
jgi:hypothetical protein